MRRQSHSRRLFYFKLRGQPYGAWYWGKPYRQTSGVVMRIGPLGHMQAQEFRGYLVGKTSDGRRGKHGLKFSIWGTSGRRKKRSIEIAVHL